MNESSQKIISSLSYDISNLTNGTYHFTIVATNTSLSISSNTSAVLKIIVSIPSDSSTDSDDTNSTGNDGEDTNSNGIDGYNLYILGSVVIFSLLFTRKRKIWNRPFVN